MAVKFLTEIYDYLKQCDPQAILMGEGTLLDAPVNVFSIHANPIRAVDGLGPRDFFLSLNQRASKRITIDQGPNLFPASGYCCMAGGEKWAAHNRYVTKLLAERGGPKAFRSLPGDLSVLDGKDALLFVPVYAEHEVRDGASPMPEFGLRGNAIRLPKPWAGGVELLEEIAGFSIRADQYGDFVGVGPGVYRILRDR
jgi:hypothetical protein